MSPALNNREGSAQDVMRPLDAVHIEDALLPYAPYPFSIAPQARFHLPIICQCSVNLSVKRIDRPVNIEYKITPRDPESIRN